MPNPSQGQGTGQKPVPAPVTGLQQASSGSDPLSDLAQTFIDRNKAVSGQSSQPAIQAPHASNPGFRMGPDPPAPIQPGPFKMDGSENSWHWNPETPELQGLLQAAGVMGQRNQDIELQEPFEDLMRRASTIK